MFYWLLFVLLFTFQVSVTTFQFHLYHTDRVSSNSLDHDCLLYDIRSIIQYSPTSQDKNSNQYQIIPYCIRPFGLPSSFLVNNDKRVIHGTSIAFEALQKENITSQQLYLLSAPIDVVERYQEFLEKPNSSLSTQVFNNCSKPWFGEYCQYSFNLTWFFDGILWAYFMHPKQEINNVFKNGTCYTFIECNRGPSPSCLDWREICDGKIDCLDVGQDEIGCDMLHINECKENEFRCSNGFCIPKEFFNDDSSNPDCIDRSDEKYDNMEDNLLGQPVCKTDPTFRCEETTCRNEHFLSCGNGQCTMDKCSSSREIQLKKAKLSQDANSHLLFNCWRSLICLSLSFVDRQNLFGEVECGQENKNENLFRESCSPLFFFPAQPIMLNHVRFAYANNLTNVYDDEFGILLPHYICYDQEICQWIPATILIHGLTCRHSSEFDTGETLKEQGNTFENRILNFFLKCSTTTTNYVKCPKLKPFRCANSSKCIALNRLLDGFPDCFQEDDEQITNSCSLPDIDYRFRCTSEKKCVPMTSTNKLEQMCIGGEDASKLMPGLSPMIFQLSFTILCDGFIDHTRIDGLNYTDEMDCEENWPCNNAYTRCNGKWNCRNAIDEANCPYNPCRPNGHPCILPFSHNFTCLPLSRINDGHIDCVGGYDEQDRCEPKLGSFIRKTYRCFNETQCIYMYEMCSSNVQHCSSGDDQDLWCRKLNLSYFADYTNIYQQPRDFDYDFYWFQLNSGLQKDSFVYFTLKNHLLYPPAIETITNEYNSIAATTVETVHSNPFDFKWHLESKNHGLSSICNRGILIYVNNFSENSCLCPPAYFGYRCEYQNQRISLTLQFLTVELRTIFNFVIMLIDENTNIHSSEQIDYVFVRDCRKKFNFYFLYSTRPKNINRTYYVRIDTYNKEKMEYYVSMIYPIQYSFLPVHRLSLQVNVPVPEVRTKSKTCPLKCMHGQCRHYSNSDQYFCQCSEGYSGILCGIENSCNCSSDSICIGVVNNRSICVCPLDKFGPRCYLKRTICASNPCSNNSRCIPGDEKNTEMEYFCLCSQGYMGSRCENLESKIEFNFSKTIFIPQTIFIHFVYIPPIPNTFHNLPPPPDPTQITMMSKLKFHESSTIVYYGGAFHLVFVEFHQQYYLALLQHNFISAMNISTTIIPEHRCLSTKDLFTDDIRALPRWHRAKKYHIPCQKYPNLTCFYDSDYFMCLCDIDRYPNCFKFDYPSTYNCLGYNYCENNGQCFQDHNTCPTSSACLCKECYYGSRCQFITTGFGLSLDDILGYNIWPNVSFLRQPTVVKITTAFTVLMFIIGIINGVLSMITFQTKKSLGIGSGVYLLASSITSLLTMTLFTLKFFLLVFSQMSIITNYSFLLSHCICTDILLKAFLAIGEWLNACVSIERIFTIRLGINFNIVRSKKAAKRVIFGLYLFILASFLHDPLNRHLLEDSEERRTWCVVRYSSSIARYASFINFFHFLLPLCINVISVLFMIVLIAQRKSKTNQAQTYRKHLWKQFRRHKHRLLSSFVLVILGMPRLITSLVSKCMKSARNPWLYLNAYFISFIPSLLLFILYILPSKFYQKEFNTATIRIIKTIQNPFPRK